MYNDRPEYKLSYRTVDLNVSISETKYINISCSSKTTHSGSTISDTGWSISFLFLLTDFTCVAMSYVRRYMTDSPFLASVSGSMFMTIGQESRNRPGVAQRFPGLGSQISLNSAHEGGEVVSLTHRPPLPPGMFLVLMFTRGWVDPRAMVWSEGNMSPAGIDPRTVRLVAQSLNHHATHNPSKQAAADARLKADSHIACRSPAIPCPYRSLAMPRPFHTPTMPCPSWKSAW
jgi:hypothetical protein